MTNDRATPDQPGAAPSIAGNPDPQLSADRGPRSRGFARRWRRRIAITTVALVAFGTVSSLGYNAATHRRMAVPVGLTYVQTGDVNTRYRQWGTGGTPIVLVHGFVESADTWQTTAPLLAAAGHRVYALDLDGFGYTQRAAPFDREHQATQLLAFLAALRLDRPVLVGHSSGAAIIATAALRAPARVGALLFLDGDGLNTGAGAKTSLTRLLIKPFRTTLIRLAVRSDAAVRTLYASACGASCPRLDAAGIDQWRRPLQVPGAEESLWAMVTLGVPGLSAEGIAKVATLGLPTAVVFGAEDSSYDPQTPADTASRIGAPAPTIIPGAGHLTPVNSPAAVTAAIVALAARI